MLSPWTQTCSRAPSCSLGFCSTRSESMLGRGFAVLCTVSVSLMLVPVSGVSQDWTATKPKLKMQAALESGVPAKRRVAMLATKKGGTRLAVVTFRGGEFSPPVVAGDCYKVVAASEKVRNICTLNVPTCGRAHTRPHTPNSPRRCANCAPGGAVTRLSY